ncbi:alanine--glyoxylate aminotransferase 2, mitochondrial-like [Lingula anatina]|uniref:Alanine--glyoxylate aminotransferase 2, mitochondrial n=1 Tax=Lingula anatina TaxID=7574 RepID=A0A1S3IEV7_LINAN|nr:alanine--glyoxylate aminotransferase 2, mitochondrial-like [Lingula anatina]|eukprot:XP_013396767.1 alanine--glyoxylate aminotransferase 2, mitochondrial-like [Lingula anatina]
MALFSKIYGALGRNVRTGAIRCMSSAPQMPPCDFKPEPYQGISYDKAREVRQTKLNPGMFVYYKKPVMIHQGHMQYLWDVDGKRYLDLFAGIVTVSVGHCHPKTLKAADDQMKKLWHTTNIYLHPAVHQYAEELTAKLPEHLSVVYFVNSGSEANDMALHMARLYSGCYEVVGLRNAYHGVSPYVIGLTAHSTWRYNMPAGFGIHQAMNADPYRGVWGGKHCRDSPVQTNRSCSCAEGACEAVDRYIHELEEVMRYTMPKGRIGAFFAESIQGVGGTVQFPKGYLKKAFDLVHSKGGVCVSDEVQTGFGRLGSHYWGFETHGVKPDIVTMAKGMGNGIPLAAVVTTPEIGKVMAEALHFNTFGGNPVSCAVGSSVLKIIDEEGLQENCAVVGTHFLEGLAKLRDQYDIVGDVRGKGLMIGIEMVTDQASRTPLPADKMATIWEDTKEMGILIGKGGFYGNVFRIKPPMCVTKADADFALGVLNQVFEKHRDIGKQ